MRGRVRAESERMREAERTFCSGEGSERRAGGADRSAIERRADQKRNFAREEGGGCEKRESAESKGRGAVFGHVEEQLLATSRSSFLPRQPRVHRFCTAMWSKVSSAEKSDAMMVYYISEPQDVCSTNASFLLASYVMLHHGHSPEQRPSSTPAPAHPLPPSFTFRFRV